MPNIGAPVRAYIRARDVMLSLKPPEEISALNVLSARIAQIAPAGAQADVRLDCNGAILMSRVTSKSVERLALIPGRPADGGRRRRAERGQEPVAVAHDLGE